MDKAWRHEMKMLRYARRLRDRGLKGWEGNFHCFRTTGSPCSCYGCSGGSYERSEDKRRLREALLSSGD